MQKQKAAKAGGKRVARPARRAATEETSTVRRHLTRKETLAYEKKAKAQARDLRTGAQMLVEEERVLYGWCVLAATEREGPVHEIARRTVADKVAKFRGDREKAARRLGLTWGYLRGGEGGESAQIFDEYVAELLRPRKKEEADRLAEEQAEAERAGAAGGAGGAGGAEGQGALEEFMAEVEGLGG